MDENSETIRELFVTELADARKEIAELQSTLVRLLDFRAVSRKRAKVPVNALLYLHGLDWRSDELASNACDAFERGDVVTAILLTRAVVENSAAAWHLMELLSDRAKSITDEELQAEVFRLIMGHKVDDAFPKAVNVLSMLDRASKKITFVRKNYDQLSEFAHPNWSGVMGSYVRTNKQSLSASFGRGERRRYQLGRLGLVSLRAALAMQLYAGRRVREQIPALVERVEASLPD